MKRKIKIALSFVVICGGFGAAIALAITDQPILGATALISSCFAGAYLNATA